MLELEGIKSTKKKKNLSEENEPIKTEKNDLLSHYLTQKGA